MRRRAIAVIASGLITLAGCAGSDPSTGAPVDTVTADSSTPDTPVATSGSSGGDTSNSTEPSEEPAEENAGSADEISSAPEACSTDGGATELSPLPGAAPQVAVEAAFANSPLPNVSLRRVNCDPTFVNLKNEAPTDKPVLYWFWAPF